MEVKADELGVGEGLGHDHGRVGRGRNPHRRIGAALEFLRRLPSRAGSHCETRLALYPGRKKRRWRRTRMRSDRPIRRPCRSERLLHLGLISDMPAAASNARTDRPAISSARTWPAAAGHQRMIGRYVVTDVVGCSMMESHSRIRAPPTWSCWPAAPRSLDLRWPACDEAERWPIRTSGMPKAPPRSISCAPGREGVQLCFVHKDRPPILTDQRAYVANRILTAGYAANGH